MSQQVFILLFLISKMSLYEELSANHKTHFDLSNHRSCFIVDIVHFSEIKGAISYQIIVTVFCVFSLPKVLTFSHEQNRLSIPTYSRFLVFLSWSLFFVCFFVFEYTSERQPVSCVWSGRAGWEEASRDRSSRRWSRAPAQRAPGWRSVLVRHLSFSCSSVSVSHTDPSGTSLRSPSRAGLMYFSYWISKVGCMKRALCNFKKQNLQSWPFILVLLAGQLCFLRHLRPHPRQRPWLPLCHPLSCLGSICSFPPNSQSPKPCAWPLLHFPRALMEHLGAPFLACYYENLFISVSVIIC